ncbi:putative hydrolase R7, partial [Pseudocercospora fuligena]
MPLPSSYDAGQEDQGTMFAALEKCHKQKRLPDVAAWHSASPRTTSEESFGPAGLTVAEHFTHKHAPCIYNSYIAISLPMCFVSFAAPEPLSPSMLKPTIVFVPGCWHVPAHFALVREELKTGGYHCVGVELPGNTHDPRKEGGELVGIADDVAAIRKTVLAELDSGINVVVVTHSYSSIPGTAALRDLNIPARKASGKKTGWSSSPAFFFPPGTTMFEVTGRQLPPQYFHENDVTLPFNGPGAIHILYNDLEHNEALKAVWRLKPQSYGINTSPVPDQLAGLKDIPLFYLMCDNDNAVPFEAQKATVEGFRASGVNIYTEVAPSGHSPFLTMPVETAKFIQKAAGHASIDTGFWVLDDHKAGNEAATEIHRKMAGLL